MRRVAIIAVRRYFNKIIVIYNLLNYKNQRLKPRKTLTPADTHILQQSCKSYFSKVFKFRFLFWKVFKKEFEYSIKMIFEYKYWSLIKLFLYTFKMFKSHFFYLISQQNWFLSIFNFYVILIKTLWEIFWNLCTYFVQVLFLNTCLPTEKVFEYFYSRTSQDCINIEVLSLHSSRYTDLRMR